MNGQKPVHRRRQRILAVCLGNLCRSPLAAVALTALSDGEVEARSAGLRNKWIGKPAHPLMIAAAAEYGFDLSRHRGVQITGAMIDWAEIVLAMDLKVLEELRPMTDDAGKLQLYLAGAEVRDPFGHTYATFVHCVTLIRDGAARYPRRAEEPSGER